MNNNKLLYSEIYAQNKKKYVSVIFDMHRLSL